MKKIILMSIAPYVLMFVMLILFLSVLGGSSDSSSDDNVLLPITITGSVSGNTITMDFTGGIKASGITGSVGNNKFEFSSENIELGMSVPSGEAVLDTYSYMPQFDQSLYTDRKLDTSSRQYKLNQLCTNDSEGFRRKGNNYLVAMGSYYGSVGDELKLYFDDGTSINVVLGDIKSDKETDKSNQYHEKGDKTVVEFIMSNRDSNNNSVINNKFGKLTEITKLGITISGSGSISGDKIVINGTASGTPFSASGTITDGNFVANGFYGNGVSGGQYLYPLPIAGIITSEFGYRPSGDTNGIGTTDHHGIDIAVPTGTSVMAMESGTVTVAGWNGGYGKCVYIDHGDGMVSKYGHLSEVSVSKGDTVKRGETVGKSGNTGNSTGPHLHFEINVNGIPVDPFKYVVMPQ